MSFDASDFLEISQSTKHYVQTVNGELAQVKGAGTITISSTLCLSNCLYGSSLSHKLLSVSHVTKELNCKLLMQPLFCMLQDIKTGTIVGRGTERHGLYYVDEIAQQSTAVLTHGLTDRQIWLLHCRLAHPSIGYLHLLFPELVSYYYVLNCETCVLAKSHRHSFKLNNTREKFPFALIHSDVWGPAPVTGGQGFRYFLLFIDDFSRMTWIYFLKTKSEVFEKFTELYSLVQTQFHTKIQILRSDNGREYVNSRMQSFFIENSLVHQTSCAYTPEQNGVAERKNRYILEITRALLLESNIPKSFWPEAVATTVYLLNRLPTGILSFKTPLEFFSSHNSVPSSLHLDPKIFGCTVFVHIPKHDRDKLTPCAVKCIFLGYGKNQKGYRCYDPSTDRMYTTMNCDFIESEYFYSQSSGQGESEPKTSGCDALNWLPLWGEIIQGEDETNQTGMLDQNPKVGPTEEVSSTTGQSDSQEQNMQLQDTVGLSDQSLNPEVNASNPDNDTSSENTNSDRSDTEISDAEQNIGLYALPYRSTWGIPPRRYLPDWKGPKS